MRALADPLTPLAYKTYEAASLPRREKSPRLPATSGESGSAFPPASMGASVLPVVDEEAPPAASKDNKPTKPCSIA